MVCGIDLHGFLRMDAIFSLALARMAAYRAAPQLIDWIMVAIRRLARACIYCAALPVGWIAAVPTVAAAAVPTVPAAVPSVAAAVPAGVAQVIAAQRLPSSAVSFVIVEADSGHVVMSHNPHTLRSPASTIKTVTTF